jgi:hypothetical protein
LRKLATSEAAAVADMIIIAAQDGPELPELPEEVIDWISQWLAMREYHSRALVAVLDSDTTKKGASPGIRSQLKKVAELGQMDFFAEASEVEFGGGSGTGTSLRPRQFVRARKPVCNTDCRA